MRYGLGMMAAFMMVCAGVAANANDSLLSVAPLRLVLKDNHPSDMLSITNKSNEPHHYLIITKDEVMGANGSVTEQANFAYSAKRMLRFTPREVTLQPGEHQNVRVMSMVPEGTPDGEYHSHIIFDEKLIPDTHTSDTTISTFRPIMKNQYSIGLPIIIQHGEVKGDLTLDGVRLVEEKGRPVVRAMLTHTGNAEASGLLTVTAEGISGSLIQPRMVRAYRETGKLMLDMPVADPSLTMQMIKSHAPKAKLGKDGKFETRPLEF